ncbi:MAG: hypothetical protein HY659_00545 [Rhizobiales bacterium]|nr:hypothetical protein [Hyphomicrobiales bacterium]
MPLWVLVIVALVVLAVSGGIGFVAGFFTTVFSRIGVDTEVACILLQKAETTRFITKDQRSRLVDIVLPERKPTEQEREREKKRPAGSASREPEWYDVGVTWRDRMKSGCPDA